MNRTSCCRRSFATQKQRGRRWCRIVGPGQPSIHEALGRYGVLNPIYRVIVSAYDGAITLISTAEDITDQISICCGVRQEYPLSPIVFNLTLETHIRAVVVTGRDYKRSGQKHSNFFFADVSESPEGMHNLLRSAEDAAVAVGLRFNLAKYAALHMKDSRAAWVRQTLFDVQGEALRSLAAVETYDHLSTPTEFQVGQTPIATIGELVADLRAVDRSLLALWQTLHIAATFILSCMDFYRRESHIQKGPLNDAYRELKRLAKSWLHLSQRANTEVAYLLPYMEGGSLLPLANMADILTVVHAFELLSSKDTTMRKLA